MMQEKGRGRRRRWGDEEEKSTVDNL